MVELRSQSAIESETSRAELQPVFDIIHYHTVGARPATSEDATASKAMTITLRTLYQPAPYNQFWLDDLQDSPVTLRISHQYSDPPSAVLYEKDVSSEERTTQGPPIEPHARIHGKNWSSALLDLIRLESVPKFLSQETLKNKDSFVDLNRLCYFCLQLCETSLAFNTRVHDQDTSMPALEPAKLEDYSCTPLPCRQVREYFDFWPSSEEMLSSAQNGCHLCTITSSRLTQTINNQGYSEDITTDIAPYFPCKLVIYWTWWLPSTKADGCGPFKHGAVKRNFYLEWPLSGFPADSDCTLDEVSSRTSLALDLSVAETSKHNILSELPTDRHQDRTNPRISPFVHPESPKLGTGGDYVLSHFTGSEAVLRMAERCIRECHTDHSCPAPDVNFRPTRLLDVGEPDGSQDPRLVIKGSSSVPIRYAALSHCWGKYFNDIYKLTAATEEELLQGVRVENLSRTFQDAVHVCRKLETRYVWIDSLCIKQDSDDDWAREAAQMHLVYTNSYYTIAAACASGDEEGFLRSRNPRGTSRRPHSIRLLYFSTGVVSCYWPTYADPSGAVHQACNLPTKVGISISNSTHWSRSRGMRRLEPLFQRAWALQERLLSPRILRFGEESIIWECEKCHQADKGAAPVQVERHGVTRAEIATLRKTPNVSSSLRDQRIFLMLWKRLVSKYTAMALTRPQDRSVAFHGITSWIAGNGTTGSSFFNGLPVACFVPSLLWQFVDGKGTRARQSIATSNTMTRVVAESCVNTLSWASIEGAVNFWHSTWRPYGASVSLEAKQTYEVDNGALILQDRTQVIELLSHAKPSGPTGDEDNSPPHAMRETDKASYIPSNLTFYVGYRYATRLISLVQPRYSPSRVTLEGPTFSFTTETAKSEDGSNGLVYWNHPLKRSFRHKRHGGMMRLDLLCLRFPQVGLSMQVTCLTVVEWVDAKPRETRTNLGGGDPDEFLEPDSAAGIVLIRGVSEDRGAGVNREEGSEEVYTRIGYWELVPWNENHPPYKPIRQEARVRQVTVI